MENLLGRYIKVINPHMGGDESKYKKGDYLKVIRDDNTVCIYVEHCGVLNVRSGNHRIAIGDIELMPEGFDPKNIQEFYEIF